MGKVLRKCICRIANSLYRILDLWMVVNQQDIQRMLQLLQILPEYVSRCLLWSELCLRQAKGIQLSLLFDLQRRSAPSG